MTPTEQWRPVVGHDRYSVSNTGRVRVVRRNGHKVLRLFGDGRGYLYVRLYRDRITYWRRVHVLVAEAFLGPRPEGLQIRHLDGNSHRNVVENLAYGTHSENEQDKLSHGTHNHARKTHCRYGHPFSGDNLAIRANGSRRCLACHREEDRRRYHARKAAATAVAA